MAASNLGLQYKMANIMIKLIVINTVIFLGIWLSSWIFAVSPEALKAWFVLPTSLLDLLTQPWSILTYAFLHYDFWHIFWNMLILYWFGNIVLNLFTEKRFLTVYLLGAIAGAIMFVLSYNLFPVLHGSFGNLQGASAAVMAIMIFIATYTPNTEVRVIFFNVKLWQIGLVLFLLDLVRIPTSGNAGGLLSHVGGAVFGYVYAQQLAKGKDIGLWWENLMDYFANFFKKREKAAKMKTVYRNRTTTSKRQPSSKLSKSEQQRKIDTILDKISKSGYDSLSKQEKDFLFKAGKDS